MSLITQCPACSTMFRVVPDQLRISDGWVRCGQCDEVFDANAHLRDLEQTHSAPAPEPRQPQDPEPHLESQPELQQEPQPEIFSQPVIAPQPELIPQTLPAWESAPAFEPEPALEEPVAAAPMETWSEPAHSTMPDSDAYDWGPASSPRLSSALPEITLDIAEPVSYLAPPYTPEADPFLEHSPQEPRLEQEPVVEQDAAAHPDDWLTQQEQQMQLLRLGEEQTQEAQFVPEDAVPIPDDVAPSFMAPVAAPSWWSHGMGKTAVLGAGALLLLVLAVQLLVSERDRLAATAPALRPLLVSGCEVLGCRIAPLRRIEAISIDSSAFSSIRPGVYLLQVTLKNAAATELATPALELTLTDAQDQALLRRVVLPAEFSGKAAIAAGAELAASLPVSVKQGAVPEKISGYKLLAFYP